MKDLKEMDNESIEYFLRQVKKMELLEKIQDIIEKVRKLE